MICKPILGMNFLPHLGFIAVQHCALISCLDNHFAMSFRLKSNAIMDGMHFPARPLPFSMRIMVESELQRLLQWDVIYSVDNSTISAPIAPVRKQVGASNPIRL